MASSPSASAVSGESEAGFSTTQLPAARAGAAFQQAIGKGKVPGHDAGDHAHGLPQGEIEAAAGHRDRLAAELGDGAGVILEHPRAQARLHPGHR